MAKGAWKLPQSAGGGTNISDATATELDVLSGKTFYAGSAPKKTGTMPDNGTVSTDITTKAQEVTIAAGKHSGAGIVKIASAEQAKIIAGNIKKDVTILGVTGTLDATPSVICPANGYVLDTTWTAPVTIPDPSAEQILLLCDDKGQGAISVSLTVSSGNRKFELLTTDLSTVLFSATFASSYTYNFPTQNTGAYYVVRLSPATAGQTITNFIAYNSYTGYNIDWRILQAKFNTPNMTSLANAFQNMTSFKECIFLSNMNSLTTLASAFASTGIEKITWPSQMTSLTNLSGTFQYTFALKKITFPSTLASLTTMASCFYQSSVIEVVLPTSLTSSSNISFNQLFYNCYFLEKITYPTSCDHVSDISQMHYQCFKLAQPIVLPALPYLTLAGSAFYNCYLIPKITFTGPSNLCTNFDSLCSTCKSLTELVMPTSMNALTTTWGNMIVTCNVLQKVTLPNSMTALSGSPNTFSSAYTLKEITTCAQWSANQMTLLIYSQKITAFYQPTLRVAFLKVGYNNSDPLRAPFTSVEIDWANSAYSGSAPQLTLYGNMNATELNRIFTALPTVTGKTIDVRGNPGYSTCNKTIATAKGWTVS